MRRFVPVLILILSVVLFLQFTKDLMKKHSAEPFYEFQMVGLDGGEFLMGSNSSESYVEDNEGPVRMVSVSPFRIQSTEVTNHMFTEFIVQSGYKTTAEYFGWSFVVEYFLSDDENLKAIEAVERAPWWVKVHKASWDHPEGSDSTIIGRHREAVAHVSYSDAATFCAYYGMRLPTEEEWEYAARGGLESMKFPWGNERMGENRTLMANVFQVGILLLLIGYKCLDGYVGVAPVGSFPANGFGLFDMSGNVWEWTSSDFNDNPNVKTCKGGSFMCHRKYCYRYRCASRTGNTKDTSTQNIGFRCAVSRPMSA